MSDQIKGPKTVDPVASLNTRLASNAAFVELFKAVREVINRRVTEPRNQLATIRDPMLHRRGDWVTINDGRRAIINNIRHDLDGTITVYAQAGVEEESVEFTIPTNLKDRAVQINGAQYHGFRYFSDTLSTEDYARINEFVELYWPKGGTEQFVRFIGFIKNIYLDIDTLWSYENTVADEYPELEVFRQNYKTPVWNGGDYYPTSHVQLRYDVIANGNVDTIDLFYLFYLMAPIHLVLHRIIGEIVVTAETKEAVILALAEHTGGLLDFSETVARSELIDAYALGSINGYTGGWLILNSTFDQQTAIPA